MESASTQWAASDVTVMLDTDMTASGTSVKVGQKYNSHVYNKGNIKCACVYHQVNRIHMHHQDNMKIMYMCIISPK